MDLSKAPAPALRRAYVPVRLKFAIALAVALAWTTLSVWIAERWLVELGQLTHPLFALVAISFIAFVPGFMNAFLVATLLLDRRPKRRRQVWYPGVTVLAAYQEEAAIADTIRSVAAADYPGSLEVLVLNDGSTDRTSELARQPRAPRDIVRWTACFIARRKATRRSSWSATERATSCASISGTRTSSMLRRSRRSVAFCSAVRSRSAFWPPRPMTMPGFAVFTVIVTWLALRSISTWLIAASGSVRSTRCRSRRSSCSWSAYWRSLNQRDCQSFTIPTRKP
jgi:hypothetical protein